MNNDFPLLDLVPPQVTRRRSGTPRIPQIPPEILSQRADIARKLLEQVAPVASELSNLSDGERQNFFVKLEHDRPVQLSGTGLKALAESSENVTLAVPTSNNLDALQQKLQDFGNAPLRSEGHAPNEQLGTSLKAIERGKPTDRLSDYLYEKYEDLVKQDFVRCEIELLAPLPRGNNQRRIAVQSSLRLLNDAFSSGIHGTIFEHEEMRGTIRAVIRCTGSMFRRLVEDPEWQTRISLFEERPEFQTFTEIQSDFTFTELEPIASPDDDAPVVCIMDSGVTPGNPFLEPVSREDLFKTFLEDRTRDPYDEVGHGSGTATLAAYYALNLSKGAINEPKVWIASARILDENNEIEDRLFSKTIREVVDYFHPLGVRVFNLSANIINRHWNMSSKRTMSRKSWVARAIDQISVEKDVVFVICTGNLTIDHVRNYYRDGKPYPTYFVEDESRLSDPAQASLALTVGAVSATTLINGPNGSCSPIAQIKQPAPFTRGGPGMAKEVKPELVEYSGNYMLDSELGRVRENYGLSVPVASNFVTPAVKWLSGTSCAAPRVTYNLALILQDLEAAGLPHVSASLLKAFAVNSATYPDGPELEQFREEFVGDRKNDWLNVMGYGIPDYSRATACDPYTATLFFQGHITPDRVAYFNVPVPALLAQSGRERKRLTVTVAHAPDVQRWGLERYLGTTLRWSMFRGDISTDEVIDAMSPEEYSSDEQSDLPNELKFKYGTMLRSRGTIQHDIFEWHSHREAYSANPYTLAIAAYEKWKRTNPPPIPYAVVVRLEDTSRTAAIYPEVKASLINMRVQGRV